MRLCPQTGCTAAAGASSAWCYSRAWGESPQAFAVHGAVCGHGSSFDATHGLAERSLLPWPSSPLRRQHCTLCAITQEHPRSAILPRLTKARAAPLTLPLPPLPCWLQAAGAGHGAADAGGGATGRHSPSGGHFAQRGPAAWPGAGRSAPGGRAGGREGGSGGSPREWGWWGYMAALRGRRPRAQKRLHASLQLWCQLLCLASACHWSL